MEKAISKVQARESNGRRMRKEIARPGRDAVDNTMTTTNLEERRILWLKQIKQETKKLLKW